MKSNTWAANIWCRPSLCLTKSSTWLAYEDNMYVISPNPPRFSAIVGWQQPKSYTWGRVASLPLTPYVVEYLGSQVFCACNDPLFLSVSSESIWFTAVGSFQFWTGKQFHLEQSRGFIRGGTCRFGNRRRNLGTFWVPPLVVLLRCPRCPCPPYL